MKLTLTEIYELYNKSSVSSYDISLYGTLYKTLGGKKASVVHKSYLNYWLLTLLSRVKDAEKMRPSELRTRDFYFKSFDACLNYFAYITDFKLNVVYREDEYRDYCFYNKNRDLIFTYSYKLGSDIVNVEELILELFMYIIVIFMGLNEEGIKYKEYKTSIYNFILFLRPYLSEGNYNFKWGNKI